MFVVILLLSMINCGLYSLSGHFKTRITNIILLLFSILFARDSYDIFTQMSVTAIIIDVSWLHNYDGKSITVHVHACPGSDVQRQVCVLSVEVHAPYWLYYWVYNAHYVILFPNSSLTAIRFLYMT